MWWIAVAGQLSNAVPVGLPSPDVRAVFAVNDMPVYVQAVGITRFVLTRLTVGPDGNLQDCGVERPSGDGQLDAYTCRIFSKRAKKFQPAKWIDGSAAYGVLSVPVTWAIGGQPSKSDTERAYPPDMELSVNRLPPGADEGTNVPLVIAVDESGRVVGCTQSLPASMSVHAKKFPELVPIACDLLARQFSAIPAKDASGKPVQSVQYASVVFRTGR
jgi:hypothetical protein